MKTDVIQCSFSGVDGVTHLQEVLEMSIGILGCLSAKRTCLGHVHESGLQLKAVIAGLVDIHPVGMWLLDGAKN
jgi:hypothetical protein